MAAPSSDSLHCKRLVSCFSGKKAVQESHAESQSRQGVAYRRVLLCALASLHEILSFGFGCGHSASLRALRLRERLLVTWDQTDAIPRLRSVDPVQNLHQPQQVLRIDDPAAVDVVASQVVRQDRQPAVQPLHQRQ